MREAETTATGQRGTAARPSHFTFADADTIRRKKRTDEIIRQKMLRFLCDQKLECSPILSEA